MVQVDVRQSVARYRLLEPIRQYAAERLEASGEATTYRGRHCDVFFALVFAHQAGGAGPDEIASLDRLEVEHDNLRAALRWALTHDQSAAALRCTAALFRFWERRGHFQEGCSWLEQVLASTPETPTLDRGWALNSLAFLLWRGGNLDCALPIAEGALAVCRQTGLPRDVAQALLNLGMLAYLREEPALALMRLEESVAGSPRGRAGASVEPGAHVPRRSKLVHGSSPASRRMSLDSDHRHNQLCPGPNAAPRQT